MKNAIRIIIISCVLVGGAYGARTILLKEFQYALQPVDEAFSRASVAQTVIAFSQRESVSTTTSPYTGPHNFSFEFPGKNKTLYEGCTYPLAWIASTTITSMNLSLVDAGTGTSVDEGVSGIQYDVRGEDLRGVLWKVGARVWPGQYFLKLESLNGTTTQEKSYRFMVGTLQGYTTASEQERLCTESGGVI